MKKTLILTAALGLFSASQLKADTDLFITGSTAFRTQVYNACLKLFTTTPSTGGGTLFLGTVATGGDGVAAPKSGQWTMTGTAIPSTGVSGTFTVHALFTGSVQGVYSLETGAKQIYMDKTGNRMTNTPTIVFSDVSSQSTPYPASGNFSEEPVAVQPFVMVKSVPLNSATSVGNVSYEQLRALIALGKIPLSSWSGLTADQNTSIYLLNRTKDSGSRRTAYAEAAFAYSENPIIYNYDTNANNFYKPTVTAASLLGVAPYGVIGAAGNDSNNVSSLWGNGYVAGGDIKNALNFNNAANQSLSYLSLSDAQGVGSANWNDVITYNGAWPTAAGSGIHGNTGTNDFTPISTGSYGLWAQEVVVYISASGGPSSVYGDQDIGAGVLGNQITPNTILGVLDAITVGNPAVTGSIDNEIELSKTGSPGATAIRIFDMVSSRSSVGGTIAP